MRTLLIIGNGFDLYCGLRSSFYDFSKSEYWYIKDEPNLWALVFTCVDNKLHFSSNQVYKASKKQLEKEEKEKLKKHRVLELTM